MTRVADLTGAELALWVARAHGWVIGQAFSGECWKDASGHAMEYTAEWKPSTDWAQGGPIIERERMSFAATGTGPKDENGNEPIVAISATGRKAMEGATHLIAAMRAFVASKFGETVSEVAP